MLLTVHVEITINSTMYYKNQFVVLFRQIIAVYSDGGHLKCTTTLWAECIFRGKAGDTFSNHCALKG
jgi:hypothetical protein